MRSMKRLAVLLSVLLMLVLCVTALVACNPPEPDPETPCTHEWVAGSFTVKPICGELTEGKRQYVCSLCGETKEETVTNEATKCAWESNAVTKEATCTEDGILTYTCVNCGDTNDRAIVKLGHKLDIYNAEVDYDANKRQIPCVQCDYTVEKEAYVLYSDFGAVGDGVAEDHEAIRDAHRYANEWGIDVWADEGATYYIGAVANPAIIQTNVDWQDAMFMIDDTAIEWDNVAAREKNIFQIDPKTGKKAVTFPSDMKLTKGQQNIGLTFDEPCMLELKNSNVKIYIRNDSSGNGNSGQSLQEVILVDENGNVDPSTPIQYDYDGLTSITAYSTTEAPITVKGGHFRTVTCNPADYDPDYENNYCFFRRGIQVNRSNTTITNVKYTKVGEDESQANNYDNKGTPYYGIFAFDYVYNVTFRKSKIQGHKAYSFFEKNGTRNEMGSYTIYANSCIGLNFIRLDQIVANGEKADITDRVQYHGIMGSNFCRNTLMDDCYVDRFDSHQGMHNATIRNSTIGFGILVIGGGDLIVENVTRLWGAAFISLRADYNSVFDGDIYIINCVAEENVRYIIGGNWYESYCGLPNYMVRNVYIDGLEAKYGSNMMVYNIAGLSQAALDSTINPLLLPESISWKGIKGRSLIVSNNVSLFESVEVTRGK